MPKKRVAWYFLANDSVEIERIATVRRPADWWPTTGEFLRIVGREHPVNEDVVILAMTLHHGPRFHYFSGGFMDEVRELIDKLDPSQPGPQPIDRIPEGG